MTFSILACGDKPHTPRDSAHDAAPSTQPVRTIDAGAAAVTLTHFDCGNTRCSVATDVCHLVYSGPAHPGSPSARCVVQSMDDATCKSIASKLDGRRCAGSARTGFTLTQAMP